MPDADTNDSPGTTISSAPPPSSGVTAIVTRRDMKFYNVSDHELRTLSLANTGVAFCSAAVAFLLGIAIPIWVNLTPDTTVGTRDTALICSALALALAVVAGILLRFRHDTLGDIRAQSSAVETSTKR